MVVTLEWFGPQRRESVADKELVRRDELADAARAGRWDRVLELVEDGYANSIRVGGTSWFTPLHQVAWHGAPRSIADRLVAAGAWRTVRTSAGETPAEIAAAHGHEHLAESLTPRYAREIAPARLAQLEAQLWAVMVGRVHDLCRGSRLRPPQLGPLLEYPDAVMWCTVPGMYGGFGIRFGPVGDELSVESWCRVSGGSGQRHRIRPDGFELVEEGFV